MNHIITFLITAVSDAAVVEAKPLKVIILAGQSNMDDPAKIETFDYLGCANTFALMGKAFAETLVLRR